MWRTRAWFLAFGVIVASSGRVLGDSCPLELIPSSSVVVQFGDSVSVDCTTSLDQSDGMGWEAPVGGTSIKGDSNLVTWSVGSLKVWSIKPLCYMNLLDGEPCIKELEVTVYKIPDAVLIFEPSFTGREWEAGGTYQLQCDVRNIAPVGNLSVNWYKGNEIIHTESSDKDNKDIATPQNKSFNLTITPDKHDHGVQVLCKAYLNLGIAGPQRAPIMSASYDMVVIYPPSFISPLPETLNVTDDKPILNCSADGNPQPVYHWQSSAGTQEAMGNGSVFRPSSPLLPGTYNCTASNKLASVTKVFIVPQRENGHSLTFWLTVGLGSALALVLFGGTVWVTRRSHGQSVYE